MTYSGPPDEAERNRNRSRPMTAKTFYTIEPSPEKTLAQTRNTKSYHNFKPFGEKRTPTKSELKEVAQKNQRRFEYNDGQASRLPPVRRTPSVQRA
jgi:hypothetical protein